MDERALDREQIRREAQSAIDRSISGSAFYADVLALLDLLEQAEGENELLRDDSSMIGEYDRMVAERDVARLERDSWKLTYEQAREQVARLTEELDNAYEKRDLWRDE